MPLYELYSQEYVVWTQTLREANDDYTKHKIQKDRQKVRSLLNGLLDDREVIIIYHDEEGNEKQVIGTRKRDAVAMKEKWPELPELPISTVIINEKVVPQEHHVKFWLYPERTPFILHLDKVLKIIIKNNGVNAEFFAKIMLDNPLR